MSLRLLAFGLILSSQFAFANPGAKARLDAGKITPPRSLDCVIEAGFEGKALTETRLQASMELNEENSMRAVLFGNDHQYEVLVQYYRSEIEDDGTVHERIEVAINDIKNEIQEDYISSKVKSLLYVTSLSGSYYDNTGMKMPFDALTIECHPRK